jgi:transcriptional regulator with XRE-family HTH domain
MRNSAYHDDPVKDGKEKLLRVFGKHVRQWRQRRGLTQEALAERAHVSAKYIVELEAGRRNASVALSYRLMQALGLREAEFFRLLDCQPCKPHNCEVLLEEFRSKLSKGRVQVALLALLNTEDGSQ